MSLQFLGLVLNECPELRSRCGSGRPVLDAGQDSVASAGLAARGVNGHCVLGSLLK